MSRTNIDIDDELIGDVMKQYHLSTKKEAVDFALRRARSEPLTADEIAGLRGTGFWDGDPDVSELDPAMGATALSA